MGRPGEVITDVDPEEPEAADLFHCGTVDVQGCELLHLPSCLSLLIHVLMLLALCLETLVCLLEVDTLDLDTQTMNYGLRFELFAGTLSLSLTVSNPACLLIFPLPCPLGNLCYTVLMFVL